MIFHSWLVSSRDYPDIFYPRRQRFFDNVSDERLMNDTQYLFGCAFVAGRNLIPKPAAGITAFLIIFSLDNRYLGVLAFSAVRSLVACDS
jgi:hypothetical protein